MSELSSPRLSWLKVTHSGDKKISEFIELLCSSLHGQPIGPDQFAIDNPFTRGVLWAKELNPGVELLNWQAQIYQPQGLVCVQEQPPEQAEPVWTLMLSGYSPNPEPDAGDAGSAGSPAQRAMTPPGHICYLFNHHHPLSMMLPQPGHIHILVIRLKPAAWQYTFANPGPELSAFAESRQPQFYGFTPTPRQLSLLSSRFIQQPADSLGGWALLADVIAMCSDTFAALEQRHSSSDKTLSLRPRDAEQITRAHQLLVANFQEPPDLNLICRQVGLGRDKFRQLFFQVYGETPYTYFQQQRMAEARRLLETRQYSAMDVGHRVGYSNLGHFASAYRKYQGHLPREALKALRDSAPIPAATHHAVAMNTVNMNTVNMNAVNECESK